MMRPHEPINAHRRLCVDGTHPDGTLQGDGEDAPFYVFDIAAQDWPAGPFDTRAMAEEAMRAMQRG